MHAVLQNPGINIVLISFQGIFQLKIKHSTFEAFLVYKFTRARRNFCYIGKIWRHFKTRIDEHVKKEKKSNIYKHTIMKNASQVLIQVLVYAPTYFNLKSKKVRR